MTSEWAILIYLGAAAWGVWAFLSVVGDEIRLKTYNLKQLAQKAQEERKKRAEANRADDDSEPIEVQPTHRVTSTSAVPDAA